jgi:hypothetical protein
MLRTPVSRAREVEDGVEPEVLVERLRQQGTLRAKGFVRTSRGVQLVQGVGRRIEVTDVPVPPPGTLVGHVVVIRRAL